MSIKPTDRKARENYRKKLKRVQFDLYPTEEDIKQRLDERSAQGEPTTTYIKRLIREDIKQQAEKAEREKYLKLEAELVSISVKDEEKRKEFIDHYVKCGGDVFNHPQSKPIISRETFEAAQKKHREDNKKIDIEKG